jgi:hypothetical protein
VYSVSYILGGRTKTALTLQLCQLCLTTLSVRKVPGCHPRIWDSSVCIVMSYSWMAKELIWIPTGEMIFLFSTVLTLGLRPTQPSAYKCGALPGGGHKADLSLSFSAMKVKNMCLYTSTPPYVFMAWCYSFDQGATPVTITAQEQTLNFTYRKQCLKWDQNLSKVLDVYVNMHHKIK